MPNLRHILPLLLSVLMLIPTTINSYSVIEYKLSDKTPLSKGQKAVQNHVNGGNQMFEVRSTVDHMNLYPGKPIQVKDYRVEYKYEYKLKNK